MNSTSQITTYSVSGMTCGACVNRVKTTLSAFADKVEVTLTPPLATLTNAHAAINQLNTALSEVGHYVLAENTPSKRLKSDALTDNKSFSATYKPLLLVFGYILLVCFAIEFASEHFSLHRFMPNFMAGFFLIFSFFKLLDLTGFANSYAMYDLLAKRVFGYALIYPFIELALGIGYLVNGHSQLLNSIAFIVMVFSSIGVILAVLNKQKIKCACLGTGFNLPMTTVTIIEDVLMAAMAAWMLF
jgi:copper chaperone CopZ